MKQARMAMRKKEKPNQARKGKRSEERAKPKYKGDEKRRRRNRTNVAHGLASSSLLLVGMLAGELGVRRLHRANSVKMSRL